MAAMALADAAHKAMKVASNTPFHKSRAAASQEGTSVGWAIEMPAEKRSEFGLFVKKPPGGEDFG